MNYMELKQIFQEWKRNFPKEDLTAHIVFTEDSFEKKYPLLSRTYSFSSDNKAFRPNMGGYSIFADCLDRTEQGVRLDWYMAEEGNQDGWNVQDCYILERMQDAAEIPNHTRTVQEDGTVCYFFGDTCIQAHEIIDGDRVLLEAVSGNQASNGEWTALSMDRVHGYCRLLSRYLEENRKEEKHGRNKTKL